METNILGDNVRTLRENRGLSREQLAGRCVPTLTERTIQNVERTGRAHTETVYALAAALEVDVAALFRGRSVA